MAWHTTLTDGGTPTLCYARSRVASVDRCDDLDVAARWSRARLRQRFIPEGGAAGGRDSGAASAATRPEHQAGAVAETAGDPSHRRWRRRSGAVRRSAVSVDVRVMASARRPGSGPGGGRVRPPGADPRD